MTRLAALVSALLAAGSASAQHVTFAAARTAPLPARTQRVYFDAEGMLYPPAAIPMDDQRLKRIGTLRAYYRDSPVEFRRVREALRVPAFPFEEAWAGIQDSLATAAARRLDREAASRYTGSMVVLIHGFNVDAADAAFRVARDRLSMAAPKQRPLFLEVHWDGMQGANVLSSWVKARRHAPLVGLGLRRVLGAAHPPGPLRVLTHSLGASVAASAFWDRRVDVTADGLVDDGYLRLAGGKRLPFPAAPLRVAMIVPAIPGSALERAAGSAPGMAAQAMAIGQNPRDYAVSKVILGPGALGSTRLATTPAEFDAFVRRRWPGACRYELHNRVRALLALPSAPYSKLEDHDLARYLTQPSVDPLLRALTGEGLACP